jgi:hypothetical protein
VVAVTHDDRRTAPLVAAGLTERPLGLSGVLLILARGVATLGTTLLVYALLPIHEGSAIAIAGIAALGLVAVLGVFFRQFGRIDRSAAPVIAAVEALCLVGGIFLTLFAFIYVSISALDPGAFSQAVDKVAGIYFAVTVMSTVGFGDITPVGPGARILVTVQMVLDVVLIGAAVRLLGQHLRSVRERRSRTASNTTDRGADAHGQEEV